MDNRAWQASVIKNGEQSAGQEISGLNGREFGGSTDVAFALSWSMGFGTRCLGGSSGLVRHPIGKRQLKTKHDARDFLVPTLEKLW